MNTREKLVRLSSIAMIFAIFSICLQLIIADIFLLFWAGFFLIQIIAGLTSMQLHREELKQMRIEFFKKIREENKK